VTINKCGAENFRWDECFRESVAFVECRAECCRSNISAVQKFAGRGRLDFLRDCRRRATLARRRKHAPSNEIAPQIKHRFALLAAAAIFAPAVRLWSGGEAAARRRRSRLNFENDQSKHDKSEGVFGICPAATGGVTLGVTGSNNPKAGASQTAPAQERQRLLTRGPKMP
jgi:hypothetical protein